MLDAIDLDTKQFQISTINYINYQKEYKKYYKNINIFPCTFALNKISKHTGHITQAIKKNDRGY